MYVLCFEFVLVFVVVIVFAVAVEVRSCWSPQFQAQDDLRQIDVILIDFVHCRFADVLSLCHLCFVKSIWAIMYRIGICCPSFGIRHQLYIQQLRCE